jgi:repressor LexA
MMATGFGWRNYFRRKGAMYLTRRQRQILDYVKEFIDTQRHSPSLEEIGRHFGLTSLATVHKHLTNLEEKGLIRRGRNRSRSLEVTEDDGEPAELPFLGHIAAGRPLEVFEAEDSISLPTASRGGRRTYVLKVKGDSMIDEHIQDGDYIIVEERNTAENGETVVALLEKERATLKKYYRQGDKIRLVPANPQEVEILVDEEDLLIQGVVIGLLRKFD